MRSGSFGLRWGSLENWLLPEVVAASIGCLRPSHDLLVPPNRSFTAHSGQLDISQGH